MRKFLALIATLSISFLSLPIANAATPVIRIVDAPHRNFDGKFHDNLLATELTPTGKLGKALFAPNSAATWVIDARLVDEIQDMADGYSFEGKEQVAESAIAKKWLQQLRIATAGNPIVALPYGNPDPALSQRLAPSEINFYSRISADKLELFFARAVISQNGWSSGKSHLESQYQGFYRDGRSLLRGLSKAMPVDEVLGLRANLALLLNPELRSKDRAYFSYSARDAVLAISGKLRVVPGRYQLTSEVVKVPLTLVNKFDTATTVNISLIPLNSRIQVSNINGVTLPPKSQIQISVPFKVIASGSTIVTAQFLTPQGARVGQVSKLNFTLTVIDSRVTWFTTGAAILLFLAAVTQSVRRVRRSRYEK